MNTNPNGTLATWSYLGPLPSRGEFSPKAELNAVLFVVSLSPLAYSSLPTLSFTSSSPKALSLSSSAQTTMAAPQSDGSLLSSHTSALLRDMQHEINVATHGTMAKID